MSMDGLFREEVVEAQPPQWLGITRLALPVLHGMRAWLAALAMIVPPGRFSFGHDARSEHVAGRLASDAGLKCATARTAAGAVASNVAKRVSKAVRAF